MKFIFKNKGFTLLELTISLAIFGILIIIIYSMFKMIFEGYAYNDAILNLSNQSVQAF